MAAERGAAALLDGRHHLPLAEAQVPVMGSPKGLTMGAEDVTDLERRSGHHADLRRRLQVQILQRPLHLVEDLRRHMGVAGSIVELLVAEQHLDHPDILPLLQQVGGEGVAHTRLLISAASSARWKARLSWRADR